MNQFRELTFPAFFVRLSSFRVRKSFKVDVGSAFDAAILDADVNGGISNDDLLSTQKNFVSTSRCTPKKASVWSFQLCLVKPCDRGLQKGPCGRGLAAGALRHGPCGRSLAGRTLWQRSEGKGLVAGASRQGGRCPLHCGKVVNLTRKY